MKVGGFSARMNERTIKQATRTRMTTSCFLSSISFMQVFFRTSRVRVELEVSTSEESVDMEAERTSTITTPIRMSGSVESMTGTIES